MATKRFVLCGLSDRGVNMYALPILGRSQYFDGPDDLSDVASLVGVLDIDQIRMQRFNERIGKSLPTYQPDAFDRMLAEMRPDAVIVTGPDVTHAGYVIAALEQGVDVVVEKPLTAFAHQARDVLRAAQASTASVSIGHNLRYSASLRRMRNLIAAGTIGRVVAVDLVWGVDSYHGASYFWRWNRERKNSGGLSVHKAVHHLDMVNWLIADAPAEVFSVGARNFYGPDSPHRPRDIGGATLTTAQERRRSPYHQRWLGDALPASQDHFLGPWQEMGYPVQYPPGTDRYIFDTAIDIEDTYSTTVRFAGGASMSYTVCFSFPWEGFRLGITGTAGRIETDQILFRGSPAPARELIQLYPLFAPVERIEVATEQGGHGGSDRRIRADLLLGASDSSVRDGLPATVAQAAIAVGTGEAMWRSASTHQPVSVADTLGLSAQPAWTAGVDDLAFADPDQAR